MVGVVPRMVRVVPRMVGVVPRMLGVVPRMVTELRRRFGLQYRSRVQGQAKQRQEQGGRKWGTELLKAEICKSGPWRLGHFGPVLTRFQPFRPIWAPFRPSGRRSGPIRKGPAECPKMAQNPPKRVPLAPASGWTQVACSGGTSVPHLTAANCQPTIDNRHQLPTTSNRQPTTANRHQLPTDNQARWAPKRSKTEFFNVPFGAILAQFPGS